LPDRQYFMTREPLIVEVLWVPLPLRDRREEAAFAHVAPDRGLRLAQEQQSSHQTPSRPGQQKPSVAGACRSEDEQTPNAPVGSKARAVHSRILFCILVQSRHRAIVFVASGEAGFVGATGKTYKLTERKEGRLRYFAIFGAQNWVPPLQGKNRCLTCPTAGIEWPRRMPKS